MANLQVRRRAPSSPAAQSNAALMKQLKGKRNAEPYTYYDTQYFNALATFGSVTLANCPASIGYFNGRTEQSTHISVTNAEDANKLGIDFVCNAISVEVHCDADTVGLNPGAANAVAVAAAFVEIFVMYAVLRLRFQGKDKIVAPLSKFPAGGGVYHQVKTRNQAAAANAEGSYATNGMPTAQALRRLPEKISFGATKVFKCTVEINPGALTRLQALAAIAGNFQGFVRVNFEGTRGVDILPGTPS